MSPSPRDLRLDVPHVVVTDDLVHRLADLARTSTPTRSPRRSWVFAVVASAVGAALLSAGGAWATGALTVPGLPSPHSGPSTPTVPARTTDPGTVATSGGGLTDSPGALLDAAPSATPSASASHGSRPGHPSHPSHPVHPAHPSHAVRPTHPAHPVHPAHPSHAVRPTHPAHPVRPTHPAAQHGKGSTKNAQADAKGDQGAHG